MKPVNVIEGRVMRRGTPVAEARVILDRVRLRYSPRDSPPLGQIAGCDPIDFAVCEWTTDDSGFFQTQNLPDGNYRLRILPLGGPPMVLAPFHMQGRRQHVELGDIELAEAAQVRGTVLLPPGHAFEDLEAFLFDEPDFPRVPVDAQGRFAMQGLPAGIWTFAVESKSKSKSKRLMPGAQTTQTMQSGQTSDVSIDARDFGACRVELQVSVDGEVRPRMKVWLNQGSGTSQSFVTGDCDSEGRVSFMARAASGSVDVLDANVVLTTGFVLDLAGRQAYSDRLEVTSTDLTLQLPEGIDWPKDGYLEWTGETAGRPHPLKMPIELRDGVAVEILSNWIQVHPGLLQLRILEPGKWRGTLRIGPVIDMNGLRQDPGGPCFPRSQGRSVMGTAPTHEWTWAADLVRGLSNRVELPGR
ncbi:MAG: hypothetical protein R3E96_02035 [Planctomycetota bacterium]